jgi:hypothetical protein
VLPDRPVVRTSPWLALLLTVSAAPIACGSTTQCADYLPASIPDMRQARGSGCFELAHVVLLARTPSTTAPRLYLQDPRGGDFSAVVARCDPRSAHPCPIGTVTKVSHLIDGASVIARGYYEQGSVTGFETLYLDEIEDQGTLLAFPPPAPVRVADLARAARLPGDWFQIVTASIPIDDPLVMYDFSPREFALTGPCPAWSGFGMIPFSAADAMVPVLGCGGDAGVTNPAGVSEPDTREILVGRQFFKDFFASTDCACAAASKQHRLSAASTLLGPAQIQGILILQRDRAAGAYQVFEPVAKGFPITER